MNVPNERMIIHESKKAENGKNDGYPEHFK
jgi:hypothetical protein